MSPPNRAVCDEMWKKYGTARHASGDNTMRHRKVAICMSDNQNKNTQHSLIYNLLILSDIVK